MILISAAAKLKYFLIDRLSRPANSSLPVPRMAKSAAYSDIGKASKGTSAFSLISFFSRVRLVTSKELPTKV